MRDYSFKIDVSCNMILLFSPMARLHVRKFTRCNCWRSPKSYYETGGPKYGKIFWEALIAPR